MGHSLFAPPPVSRSYSQIYAHFLYFLCWNRDVQPLLSVKRKTNLNILPVPNSGGRRLQRLRHEHAAHVFAINIQAASSVRDTTALSLFPHLRTYNTHTHTYILYINLFFGIMYRYGSNSQTVVLLLFR